MKVATLLLCVAVLTGCAAPTKPAAEQQNHGPDATSALAFDPPVTLNVAPLDLSRDSRGPAAFVGYEDASTTYFDTFTDDRQSTDSSDRVLRQNYSSKIGDIRR